MVIYVEFSLYVKKIPDYMPFNFWELKVRTWGNWYNGMMTNSGFWFG